MRQPPYIRTLFERRMGFAREVTGGADGDLVTVTRLDDSGVGSLRYYAEADEPLWIRFDPDLDGTIELQSRIHVKSDKTIDGRGAANVKISGHDLVVGSADEWIRNVIIHNLYFHGLAPDDRVKIRDGPDLVWVDRCTLDSAQDGLIDITRFEEHEADAKCRVSVTRNRLQNTPKASLVSANIEHEGDVNLQITYAYNHWRRNTGRQPRVRYATVHCLNNVYEAWGAMGVLASQRSRVLVQGCHFWHPGAKQTIVNHDFDYDPDVGNVRYLGENNLFLDIGDPPVDLVENNPEVVPDSLFPYPWRVLHPNARDFRDYIRGNAGWQEAPWPD